MTERWTLYAKSHPVWYSLLVYRLVHAPVKYLTRESWVRLPDREHATHFCRASIWEKVYQINFYSKLHLRFLFDLWTGDTNSKSDIHDQLRLRLKSKVIISSSKNTLSIRICRATSVRRTHFIISRDLQSLTRRYDLIVQPLPHTSMKNAYTFHG